MGLTGYSKTPLAKKLGIKAGHVIRLVNMPEHYFELFSDWPEGTDINIDTSTKCNLIHFFARDVSELESILPRLKKDIVQNGIIWVSWPKKAAKIATDINEHIVRQTGLRCGLVDIKVCAVDEVWSGLKFVIPVRSRKS